MRQQQHSEVGMGMVIIAMLVFIGLTVPVYANVIVQTVIGDAQFSVDGQEWMELTQGSAIQPGVIVQTGAGSEVILQAEDGSVFYAREFSQLRFLELTFTNDVRMYQMELLQGMVDVDVPFFSGEADNDLVQILTRVAIADATTSNDRPTSFQITYESSIPLLELYNFSGTVTLRQTADGATNIAGLFGGSDGAGKEGLTFPINLNGAVVEVEVQPEAAMVIVSSTGGVEELVTMLGDYIGMETTNLGEDNQSPLTLFMPNGEDVLTLEKKGDKIFVANSPSNLLLGAAPQSLYAQFKFFRELGTFWMWDLCDCGGVTWGSGIPPTGGERPVVPLPPNSPPEAPGSPILP